MIDQYVINNKEQFTKYDVGVIRNDVGQLDNLISDEFEKLLDQERMKITPIHEKIAELLNEVRDKYSYNHYKFYNDVYTCILVGLLSENL